MRTNRIRQAKEACYCHLTNRVAGDADSLPFGEVEKERLLQLALELSRFYSVEMLSFVCMGSHWHAVCVVPAERPSRTEVIANWRALKGELAEEPDWRSRATVAKLAARMGDVSCFVKDMQQRFTCWYNRVRRNGRRGGLWADRFKNVILEGSTALWPCLAYVETNPVRAGLVQSPGDYRFSTWGLMVGDGTHPFAANLARHLRQTLGASAEGWSDEDVLAELAAKMARVAADEDDAEEAPERCSRDRFAITVRRRVPQWTDGAVIGSESFVREVGAQVFANDRAMTKRLARGVFADAPDRDSLFCYRRLGPGT